MNAKVIFLIPVAASLVCMPAFADKKPTVEDLEAKIQKLEARIAELESDSSQASSVPNAVSAQQSYQRYSNSSATK